jgi:LPXTG-site transpeptidase (sortase) family protein
LRGARRHTSAHGKALLANAKRIALISMVAVGVGIILYPWANALRFDFMQRKLMRLWGSASGSAMAAPLSDSGAWDSAVAVIGGADAGNGAWDEDTEPRIDMGYLLKHMQGTISIEGIRLYAPILDRVTEYNLDVAICSAVAHRKMGDAGNYVLSGHNSRIYGRHFSRIHELEQGDAIVLDDGERVFTYRVTDSFTVAASDTWVMHDEGDRPLLTLITCYYGTNPTGRLIVRAELAQ